MSNSGLNDGIGSNTNTLCVLVTAAAASPESTSEVGVKSAAHSPLAGQVTSLQPVLEKMETRITVGEERITASFLAQHEETMALLQQMQQRLCSQQEELNKLRSTVRERDLQQAAINERMAALLANKEEEANSLRAEAQATQSALENAQSRLAALEAREDMRERFLPIVRRWCADANKRRLSPLYRAARAGDNEGVQALLQCTSDDLKNESEDVKMHMNASAEERLNKAEATQVLYL